jgi:soluble lytic murein transglycosylase
MWYLRFLANCAAAHLRLPARQAVVQTVLHSGLILLLAAWVCLQPVAAGETDRLSAQRQAFQAAEQALQSGQAVTFSALADYPLYPYLLYRDLTHRLTKDPAAEVRSFLKTYDDTPLAGRLRSAWLQQLAKEQRWADFLQDYRPTADVALNCWQRQALLQTGQSDQALQGIEQLWLSGTALPVTCDPLINRWAGQGGLTLERLWQRFALTMSQGEQHLAHQLQTLLPANDRATAELWLAVDDNPRLVLDSSRCDINKPHVVDILLHGLRRWSRLDSVSAATALDTLKARYPLDGGPWTELERQIAVFMAGRGHPDALRRLTALPAAVVDTQVREWRVRIAVKQGDWNAALNWLDQLAPQERADLRWQYWRARALEATGRHDEAQGIYQQLAGQRDYHGFLAADRLALPYQFNANPLPVADKELDSLEQLPGLQRARELYLLERLPEATTEWNYSIDRLSQEDLKKAAKLAQRWSWHYQAIVTLARTGYWDDLELRFPMPYGEQVSAAARHNNLDPAWVYAIMRQESSFRTDAASSAGALGLMQLLPATGQQVARNLQRSPPGLYDLLQTDLNINYATYYLRQTLEHFQGNLLLTTAAYNAGSDKVAEWLPAQGTLPADVWAETIPYMETRKYVQKVMEYATIYGRQVGSGSSITARLGQIPSRAQATAQR